MSHTPTPEEEKEKRGRDTPEWSQDAYKPIELKPNIPPDETRPFLVKEDREYSEEIYPPTPEELKQQAEKDYQKFKKLNAADSAIFSMLMSIGLATLFYLLNPWAALAAGVVSFAGYFGFLSWLGNRKAKFYRNQIIEERPVAETPEQQASYKRYNSLKSTFSLGLPILVGGMALAFPPMPIIAWISKLGIFGGLGVFGTILLSLVIPVFAIIFAAIGIYLQNKKDILKQRLRTAATVPVDLKAMDENIKDTFNNIELEKEKCKARRWLTATIGAALVSSIATAAFIYSLPVNTVALTGSTTLSSSSLLGILGLTVAVSPLVLIAAAAAAAITAGLILYVGIKKFLASRKRIKGLEEKTSDSLFPNATPSLTSDKAINWALATITIVAAAICTLGTALIITAIGSIFVGISAWFKHREGDLKYRQEVLILEAKKKKKEAPQEQQSTGEEAPRHLPSPHPTSSTGGAVKSMEETLLRKHSRGEHHPRPTTSDSSLKEHP